MNCAIRKSLTNLHRGFFAAVFARGPKAFFPGNAFGLVERRSPDVTLDRRPLKLRRPIRAIFLIAATLSLMSLVAAAMLAVAVVTLFRARRFYKEVMATWLARTILRMWGIKVKVRQDRPFPKTQAIYISNHTSTLDVFVLISLGLPNTRFFIWGGTRKWLPMAVIGYLIGTFYTPSQTRPSDRVKCFQKAERVLRRTGESVYLSPEGARITTGKIGPFNKGAFHLATNLKAPIVPLYIDIPPESNPGLGFEALPGTVHVYVQPVIPTSGWKLDDLVTNKQRMRALYVEMQSKLGGATS
jgi:putative phosphoserine phosphatase/1-acylglycerol-3-phosphate O-acyltransferase